MSGPTGHTSHPTALIHEASLRLNSGGSFSSLVIVVGNSSGLLFGTKCRRVFLATGFEVSE